MAFTYQDYLRALGDERYREDDAGRADTALSEGAWSQQKPEDQWGLMGTAGGSLVTNAWGGPGFMTRDDAGEAQYYTRDKPTQGLRGESVQDPTSGAWRTAHQDIDPEFMRQLEEADTAQGFFTGKNPMENILRGAGLVLGGGMAYNALTAGGGLFGGGAPGVVGDAEQLLANQVAGQGGVTGGAGGVSGLSAGTGALDLTEVGMGQGFGVDPAYSLGPNAPDLSTITGPIEQVTANPLTDPLRDYVTRLVAGVPGGSMPSAGGNIFGIEGLTNGDILNYGSRALGTFLNRGDAQDAREASARENQLTREQQLLLAMVNQETPYGNVEYTRDPVTGAIRRVATMNPADQANLDLRRNIQRQVGEGTWNPPARHGTALNILGYDLGGNALKG